MNLSIGEVKSIIYAHKGLSKAQKEDIGYNAEKRQYIKPIARPFKILLQEIRSKIIAANRPKKAPKIALIPREGMARSITKKMSVGNWKFPIPKASIR